MPGCSKELPQIFLVIGLARAATRTLFLRQVLAPTAVTYQSKLLGMGAAAALFGAVGFSVVPHGLCWCVGFGSGDAMARAAATSGVVLSALVGLRVRFRGLTEQSEHASSFSCVVIR